MEIKSIHFDRKKSLLKLFIGTVIILLSILFPYLLFFRIIIFFIGCSFIYFAAKSMSKSPQFTVSDEGLYCGFKLKKMIPWANIDKIILKEKSVDYRKIKYIQVVTRIKTNAPSNILVREFPLENLDASPHEIIDLLDHVLWEKKNKT
jgi:hypothetical protein